MPGVEVLPAAAAVGLGHEERNHQEARGCLVSKMKAQAKRIED